MATGTWSHVTHTLRKKAVQLSDYSVYVFHKELSSIKRLHQISGQIHNAIELFFDQSVPDLNHNFTSFRPNLI